MTLLDRTLLDELGIKLQENDYSLFDEHFETTLRNRVVTEIVAELKPDQARQLAAFTGDDAQLLPWVRQNVPDFAQIVSDEVDILLGELAENSDAISSS
ncbi:MAG TPA: hypothetical protein VFQ70_04455 [Candidatus Saccharimonadaceae bacterium]|nr:hypothetical protein [Candidatus Saccharimonadaceae bacterium]